VQSTCPPLEDKGIALQTFDEFTL